MDTMQLFLHTVLIFLLSKKECTLENVGGIWQHKIFQFGRSQVCPGKQGQKFALRETELNSKNGCMNTKHYLVESHLKVIWGEAIVLWLSMEENTIMTH